MVGKTKQMMFCPWCEEGQARTWQGMTAHVRAKHPDKIQELKDNKEMYLEKFACDEFGNPTGGSPEPKPEPEPTPEPEPKPDPEPETTQKPKNTPKEKPPKPQAPEVTPPQEKPAEGGGFLDDLRRSVFGD